MRKYVINKDIQSPVVRINHELMSLEDGLALADEAGLDLIEISISQGSSICVLDGLSRYVYHQEKAEKEKAKAAPKVFGTKEVRFTLGIGDSDLKHKKKKIQEFLETGYKVNLTIQMKGREQAFTKLFVEKLNDIIDSLSGCSKVESPVAVKGNTVRATLSKV